MERNGIISGPQIKVRGRGGLQTSEERSKKQDRRIRECEKRKEVRWESKDSAPDGIPSQRAMSLLLLSSEYFYQGFPF